MPTRHTSYRQALDLCQQPLAGEILTILARRTANADDLPAILASETAADAVHGALHRLVRDGLVTTADDGSYALTGKGRAVTPLVVNFLRAVAQWAAVLDPRP